MEDNSYFGLTSGYLDTLNESELQKLHDAGETIKAHRAKQQQTDGTDKLRQYLEEKAAARIREQEAIERLRNSFK